LAELLTVSSSKNYVNIYEFVALIGAVLFDLTVANFVIVISLRV
jgi:hypothetical protein